MNSVAVIDYGMGNLRSVSKALEHVSPDASVRVTNDPKVIAESDRVVFPGVGALPEAMAELKRLSLDKLIIDLVKEKPFLGICLGMQALFDSGEENGGCDALGILPGTVNHFGQNRADKRGHRLKVPHMGWSMLDLKQDHPMWHGVAPGSRFYFVHSYFVVAEQADTIAGVCDYGGEFCAAVAAPNIFAVQFHPEKSQALGLRILDNFMQWNGQ
ncbi:MAG: imidazole glycerol phosphate synthase subunit HisH [Gammaproteobacteria bacterium]|nr:imidazole glycerol phosphate synthase subunit HisH [Gammaproteobacteria bacterium]PCH64655.1 MAG: imidazole glycerol phosphate synthase subunit HisH [Gammaproteobacteria bacterium]